MGLGIKKVAQTGQKLICSYGFKAKLLLPMPNKMSMRVYVLTQDTSGNQLEANYFHKSFDFNNDKRESIISYTFDQAALEF